MYTDFLLRRGFENSSELIPLIFLSFVRRTGARVQNVDVNKLTKNREKPLQKAVEIALDCQNNPKTCISLNVCAQLIDAKFSPKCTKFKR